MQVWRRASLQRRRISRTNSRCRSGSPPLKVTPPRLPQNCRSRLKTVIRSSTVIHFPLTSSASW